MLRKPWLNQVCFLKAYLTHFRLLNNLMFITEK